MSALAQFVKWEGCTVSGSDRSATSANPSRVHDCLARTGCTLVTQDGSGIDSTTGAVVVSTAIEENNPDIVAARSHNVPVIHRSDLLAACVATRKTIAVAGTSGKSTVTALCFELLRACGKSPSLITGANLGSLMREGLVGNAFKGESDILVVEADESDGTLVKYHPHLALFLNVSRDHKPVDETIAMFHQLQMQSEYSVVNLDNAHLADIRADARFGLAPSADYAPDFIDTVAPDLHFSFRGNTITCPLPGKHNLSNVLAALAVCSVQNCALSSCAQALERFEGLERRFTRIPGSGNIVVIDDFAHNPEKIRAAMETAQTLSPRVHALFQPHGYGPTRFLRKELVETFAQCCRRDDSVNILPIFFAGGTVTRDIESQDLVHDLVQRGVNAKAPQSRAAVLDWLVHSAEPGDLVLSMGARDPSLGSFATEIARRLASNAAAQP